ncbi:MAG: 16S rRNA (guanine(966)-N(2))-methyltransferase RsmD [Thermodesulfobacteriota bacterium]
MRVVGGSFKGRKLASFKRASIRPTSDKVREAVFNILGCDFPFKCVLDLFAGTGAMGIEALSRGAEEVVFVDADPVALATIKKNIETVGTEARTEVYKLDSLEAVKTLSRKGRSFDLIFMDPPYAVDIYDKLLGAVRTGELLKPGALIVVELSSRKSIDVDIKGLVERDNRRYGDTSIYFFEFKEN